MVTLTLNYLTPRKYSKRTAVNREIEPIHFEDSECGQNPSEWRSRVLSWPSFGEVCGNPVIKPL